MKEITFLKQNSEKWEKYEASLDKKELENPAKVAEMFVELTDDFSYAKSNYKESKTTKYLNGLTAQEQIKEWPRQLDRAGACGRTADFGEFGRRSGLCLARRRQGCGHAEHRCAGVPVAGRCQCNAVYSR